jgi:8-oxo-dGTP pyrophosphatase MutT (NUDIX family)
MYKVFFNDRKLFLTDNFRSREDLCELINLYLKLSKIDSLYLFHDDIDELREEFGKCFFRINAAGGLVRNNKGEFLLIFRKGKWDLPKGKLEKDESFEKAALREVTEECGLTGLKLERPLLSTYHTYSYKDGLALKKTTWFEMLYSENEEPRPQEKEQITQVRWVAASNLENYLGNSFPSVRDVFTYFGV